MRWTYTIDDIQVFPVNSRDNKLIDTLENDLIYAYRTGISNSITLQNRFDMRSNDFDYIKTIEATGKHTKHNLKIYDNSILKLTCEFTVYDISFDNHKQIATIKVTPRDEYTAIQENEDIEVNVIGERSEITMDIYSYWHFFVYKNQLGVPHQDTSDSKVIMTSFGSFGISIGLYVTELVQIYKSDPIPSGFTLFSDLGDYKVYNRFPVNFSLEDIEDLFLEEDLSEIRWSGELLYRKPHNENLYTYYRLQSLGSSLSVDSTNLWIKKTAYNGRANVVLNQAYPSMLLRTVIDRVLSGIGFSGVFKSALLLGDTAETDKELPTGYPSLSNALHLIEVSDFKKPNASQEATKAILTFKQFVEYFCRKFKAKWFIDSDSNLRIELETYCAPTLNHDISNDRLLGHVYNYLSESKPNREYLSENQAFNEDFGQIETLYGTVPAVNGTKENTKNESLSTFYTDIDGLNQHLDELSDTGFILVEVSAGAVVKATGFKSGDASLQNANLSNANILNTYHRYNALQDTYYIGGRSVNAISLKRMKRSEEIFTTVPDLDKLLVTKIGAGVINSLETDMVEENNFKAEVIYG